MKGLAVSICVVFMALFSAPCVDAFTSPSKHAPIRPLSSSSSSSSSSLYLAKRRTNIKRSPTTSPPLAPQASEPTVTPGTIPTGAQASLSEPQPSTLADVMINDKRSLSQQLEDDIEAFKSRSSANTFEYDPNYKSKLPSTQGKQPSAIDGAVTGIKNAVATVLIADFFLVLVFLAWFLTGAALKGTYPYVIEKFQDIFQPVVVPSLTVLMVGSAASGLLNKDDKK